MRAKKSNKWLYAVLALALAGGATYFIVKKVKSKKGNTTTRATGLIANTPTRATGLIANTTTTANAASTPNTATTVNAASTTNTTTNSGTTKRRGIFSRIRSKSLSGIMH